jgi:integrase
MSQKRTYIPTREEYRQTVARLIEEKDLDALVAMRLGCELGMSRIEIVNTKISDIDRINKRGLWVEVAKQVRRGFKRGRGGRIKPNFEMRQREIPINTGLYQLLISYMDNSQIYLLKRHKGDKKKAFTPRYINSIYERAEISWSSHRSRHFFKNQLKDWMRKNRQIDDELVKEYLGHKKDTTELYGSLSWDYKCEVLDKVFQ